MIENPGWKQPGFLCYLVIILIGFDPKADFTLRGLLGLPRLAPHFPDRPHRPQGH